MICAAISSKSQLPLALESGADLLELRLDLIREEPEVLFSRIPGSLKVVATCRPGGYDDRKRMDILGSCMELGASYLDVEIESESDYIGELIAIAHNLGVEVIISYHNFDLTPQWDELNGILKCGLVMGGDIVKIATMVRSDEDARRLLALHDMPGRKVILGMGSKGRITRIAATYLGSEFTFASVEESGQTAPGQLTVKQLRTIFHMINSP